MDVGVAGRLRFLAAVAVLAAAVGAPRSPGDGQDAAFWQEVGVVPERRAPSVMVVADGRILVWGGATRTETARAADPPEGQPGYPPGYQGFFGEPRVDGVLFDPATAEWTRIPDAPLPFLGWRVFSAWTGSELLIWGHAYAFPSGPAPTTHRAIGALYDPERARWRIMAPQAHVRHGEAVWTGSKLVVAGRGGDSKLHAASYDPATDAWLALPDPAVRNIASLHATGDNSVLITSDDVVAAYVDRGDGWRLLPTSPFAARSLTSFTWTGRELIQYGGGVADGDIVRPQGGAAIYDATRSSWRSLDGAPATSWGAPGRAIAAGHGDAYFLAETTLWRYSNGTWTASPPPGGDTLLAVVAGEDLWAIASRPPRSDERDVWSDVLLMRLAGR